ncbi:MAG: hypothetical protein GY757_31040 [bacterium]|nr:hypothetical protein [bacterium]
MKKTLIFISIILLFSGFISAKKNFMLTVSGNYISFTDSTYKDNYGDKKYFPEGKLSIKLKGNIYLWGSYGYYSSSYNWSEWSNKGVVDSDLSGDSTSEKTIICGGVGFWAGYIARHDFSLKLEAGVCSISNKLDATVSRKSDDVMVREDKATESGLGFRINLGGTYGFSETFFAETTIGVLYAADKIDGERVKLGGFRASVGLGIRF